MARDLLRDTSVDEDDVDFEDEAEVEEVEGPATTTSAKDLFPSHSSSPIPILPPLNPALPSSPSTFCVQTLNNLPLSSSLFNNLCVLVGLAPLDARRREAINRR